MKRTSISVFLSVVLALLSAVYVQLYAQMDLTKEVIAYIPANQMVLSGLEKSLVPVSNVTFLNSQLGNALSTNHALSIIRAFPSFTDADTVMLTNAGTTTSLFQFSRVFRLFFNSASDVDNAITDLMNIDGIVYAEKNSDMQLCGDPGYSYQWYLKNSGQLSGISGTDIRAEAAWRVFPGSSSVKIGVIDVGVEITHEDLSGKASGDLPNAGKYHGTHVAGICGAKTNNPYGIKGIDQNAQIISKKIFTPDYIGDADAANKIIEAVRDGKVNVLNNSWSGPTTSATLKNAFIYAYKNNVVSVVAMGNTGDNTTQYPAAFGQSVIAVGATTNQDQIASYSSYGNNIDVSAPGSDIYSCLLGNSYGYLSGTSMATPVVTGIASLLKGYNSSLTNDDIKNIIKLSAKDLYTAGWDMYYGAGRVDARSALDRVASPYVVTHITATGGSDVGSTGLTKVVFMGVGGLATAAYLVKRHEVRKTVSFPSHYKLSVWGNGAFTTGFSAANPNYGVGGAIW